MRVPALFLTTLAVLGACVDAARLPTKRVDVASPATLDSRSCANNADCIKRGLPLLPPKPKRKNGRLAARGVLTPPPTVSAGPTTSYTFSPQIRTFTPDVSTFYFIQAVGASGADSASGNLGGRGALAEASVFLQAGVPVSFVVGEGGKGGVAGQAGGGGGGGTYVYIGNDAIVVAGGGGGAASLTTGPAAKDANFASQDGTSGNGVAGGAGGVSGNGGVGSEAGGGAGFNSAGSTIAGSARGRGGQSRVNANAFAGGLGGNDRQDIRGGYGGGGGAYADSTLSDGGGGGGYSGGGGGGTIGGASSGGGGGTYIATDFNGQPVGRQRRDIYDVRGDGFLQVTRL